MEIQWEDTSSSVKYLFYRISDVSFPVQGIKILLFLAINYIERRPGDPENFLNSTIKKYMNFSDGLAMTRYNQ